VKAKAARAFSGGNPSAPQFFPFQKPALRRFAALSQFFLPLRIRLSPFTDGSCGKFCGTG